MDADTARASLEGFVEVMQKSWAPAFIDGDRIGATFDGKGNVTLPKSFHKAFDDFYAGGWNKLSELPEKLGGYGAPPTVQWAAFEQMAGANPAICFYLLGNRRDEDHRATSAPSRRSAATCRTCSTSTGAARWCSPSRARAPTSVPARRRRRMSPATSIISRASSGSSRTATSTGRRTSCTWCSRAPRARVRARRGCRCSSCRNSGSRRTARSARATAVWSPRSSTRWACAAARPASSRSAMARRAAASCSERSTTASIRCSTSSSTRAWASARSRWRPCRTAYGNALDYARIRVQGADLKEQANKAAPRVEIIRHPDVRRMLMLQKAFAEGLRAMVL